MLQDNIKGVYVKQSSGPPEFYNGKETRDTKQKDAKRRKIVPESTDQGDPERADQGDPKSTDQGDPEGHFTALPCWSAGRTKQGQGRATRGSQTNSCLKHVMYR